MSPRAASATFGSTIDIRHESTCGFNSRHSIPLVKHPLATKILVRTHGLKASTQIRVQVQIKHHATQPLRQDELCSVNPCWLAREQRGFVSSLAIENLGLGRAIWGQEMNIWWPLGRPQTPDSRSIHNGQEFRNSRESGHRAGHAVFCSFHVFPIDAFGSAMVDNYALGYAISQE